MSDSESQSSSNNSDDDNNSVSYASTEKSNDDNSTEEQSIDENEKKINELVDNMDDIMDIKNVDKPISLEAVEEAQEEERKKEKSVPNHRPLARGVVHEKHEPKTHEPNAIGEEVKKQEGDTHGTPV